MSRNVSKIHLLENVRGLAAVYVFLTHFVVIRLGLQSGAIGFLFRFGKEAVMIFFLLSGFVIYYSFNKSKDRSFRSYFVQRWRRIYPIFLLSLLTAYLVSCQIAHARVPVDARDLAGNLFMLQDLSGVRPGVWFVAYKNDGPLWSLSYEWWFYMMFFPIVMRVPVEKQRILAFGLSLAGFATYWLHPNPFSAILWYFVIWWSGVEAARVFSSGQTPNLRNLRAQVGLLVLICIPQAIAVIVWAAVLHRPLHPGSHPLLELRLTAAAAVIFVLALGSNPAGRARLQRLLRPFGILAPISYALYVLHYPVAIAGTFFDGLNDRWIAAAAYLALAFGVAWLAEVPFQSLMNRWIKVPRAAPARITLSRGEEMPAPEGAAVE